MTRSFIFVFSVVFFAGMLSPLPFINSPKHFGSLLGSHFAEYLFVCYEHRSNTACTHACDAFHGKFSIAAGSFTLGYLQRFAYPGDDRRGTLDMTCCPAARCDDIFAARL